MDKQLLIQYANDVLDDLRHLSDAILEQITFEWRPLYGLVEGAYEQIQDVKEQIEEMED